PMRIEPFEEIIRFTAQRAQRSRTLSLKISQIISSIIYRSSQGLHVACGSRIRSQSTAHIPKSVKEMLVPVISLGLHSLHLYKASGLKYTRAEEYDDVVWNNLGVRWTPVKPAGSRGWIFPPLTRVTFPKL